MSKHLHALPMRKGRMKTQCYIMQKQIIINIDHQWPRDTNVHMETTKVMVFGKY